MRVLHCETMSSGIVLLRIICLVSVLVVSVELLRVDVGLKNQFLLGGLFPVHAKSSDETEPCGELLKDKGVQRLEAMLYALDDINQNRDIWKFSFGATIMDTCSSDSYALEQALEFFKVGECKNTNKSNRRVTAVIGAANSPVSESVAGILRLFKIPQVSYASTSEELDNVHKYPYFFRVVPSDKFQVEVILDLLKYLEWSYISTVAAQGEYGEKAVQQLRYIVTNSSEDICFAAEELLPRKPSVKDYTTIINKLLSHDEAPAVVVFLNEDKLRNLLAATDFKDARNRFLWIGSDSWGAKINPVLNQEYLAEGAITILPKRFPLKGFDEYFRSLKPATNKRNPWFREFWENQFNCAFGRDNASSSRFTQGRKTKSICTGNEDLKGVYKQEGLVPKVIDSVQVIAHALKDLCKSPKECSDWDSKINGSFLRDSVLNVKFNSSQGNNMIVRFDRKRNVPANYTIYQYRKVTDADKYEYVPIGEWNVESRLAIFEHPVWQTSRNQYTTLFGRSSCSETCKLGEERIRRYVRVRQCCWTCRPCEKNHFLPDQNSHCTPCPTGEIPNLNRTACIALKPEYMGCDWGSAWTLVPCSFACLGIIGTLLVLGVFLLYRETPVIKAAGRELCYVMLVGVLCCYIFTFILAAKPAETSCGAVRIGLGLGLSICYSAIFIKTNRISRIFNRRLSTVKRPPYISPMSQLVICACLVLIQLMLSIMWLIISPPAANPQMIENPRAYIIVCSIDKTSVLLGLVYNMMLIVLCTVYAYKTRNIPANFNEAKYISFTMYSSCIVWLAFIAIYSSTWKDLKVQSTILCMSVSMSGTVVLLCLFYPKLYIVLLKPHKNVRNLNTTTNSATSGIESSGAVKYLRTGMGNQLLPPIPTTPIQNSYSYAETIPESLDNDRTT